ncbi:MAG: acyl-CoA dehydrogenase [candidate division Zixibacteria bacterium]|nr:acyl-CoA dehydrogenase [candidate division Zixibacteria bacterium]NIS45506.1 acyl-CoA dehydrogenase [candidate division Zixibacteria bacterium]NIU13638.1 acyl-CoA dehydrogenase [candidate division Zixibacteria bacterium]NIV05673.1 acyl-CoA dehydrogenase [candidate division Zixibacteria bacterium]NIW44512.1 acyl-CoA dehydrogenase [Gammaproteobacteria bacterium]
MNFQLNEEQQMWRDAVHKFVEKEVKPHAAELSEKGELNWTALQKMGGIGILGITIDEEFGGSGVDAISAAIAIEELGWADGGTALTVAAHTGLGCAPVNNFGTTEQKERYLPSAASGQEKLAALALTEPQAGSDLQNVQTRAVKDGNEWVIYGSKAWITNAGDSDYIVTLVVTDPNAGTRGMSMIIVPTDTPGVHIAPPEKKMGLGTSHSNAITYEDVRVPLGNLLGKEGKGLHQTLTTLDGGRISIGAISVGIAQSAYEEAISYAKQRSSFGKQIADHQAIQWMIADAATEIHAARLMIYYAAWLKQQGMTYTKEGAMAKLFASEMAERVTYSAIQIHGGYGYSREYPVERMYRDARLMTIGEGTSEVQRMVIARKSIESLEKE